MNKKSIGQKILHFPLTKIIVGFVVVISANYFVGILLSTLLKTIQVSKNSNDLIIGIVPPIFAGIAYMVFFAFYEKRKITEFSVENLGRNLFFGIILGTLLQSMTILIMYLRGEYNILHINGLIAIIPALILSFSSAVFEEILLRGILYRVVEEKLGSYIALIISSVVFGVLHFSNPGASVTYGFALMLQAGFLLASAFLWSKNLWFPIALHFAWNFTQGGIYGANISGINAGKSLFTSKIEGNTLFTGGEFGPEGSIQATIFCTLAGIILLVLSIKENKIVMPYWKKSKLQ